MPEATEAGGGWSPCGGRKEVGMQGTALLVICRATHCVDLATSFDHPARDFGGDGSTRMHGRPPPYLTRCGYPPTHPPHHKPHDVRRRGGGCWHGGRADRRGCGDPAGRPDGDGTVAATVHHHRRRCRRLRRRDVNPRRRRRCAAPPRRGGGRGRWRWRWRHRASFSSWHAMLAGSRAREGGRRRWQGATIREERRRRHHCCCRCCCWR